MFKAKKILTIMSTLVLSTALMVGCGSGDKNTDKGDGGSGKNGLKVTMVTDTGGVSD